MLENFLPEVITLALHFLTAEERDGPAATMMHSAATDAQYLLLCLVLMCIHQLRVFPSEIIPAFFSFLREIPAFFKRSEVRSFVACAYASASIWITFRNLLMVDERYISLAVIVIIMLVYIVALFLIVVVSPNPKGQLKHDDNGNANRKADGRGGKAGEKEEAREEEKEEESKGDGIGDIGEEGSSGVEDDTEMKKLREQEKQTWEVGPEEEGKKEVRREEKEESKADDISEEESRGAKDDTKTKKLREEEKGGGEVVPEEEGKKEVRGEEKKESKGDDIGGISEELSSEAEDHTGTKKLREEEQVTVEVGLKEEGEKEARKELKEEESRADDIGDIREVVSMGAENDTEMQKLREKEKERGKVVLDEEEKMEISGEEKEDSKGDDIGDISERGSSGAEDNIETKKLGEEEQATGEVGQKEEGKKEARREQKEEKSKADDIADINEEWSRGAKNDTETKKQREEEQKRRVVVLEEEGKKEVSGEEKEEFKGDDIGDISEEGSGSAEDHTGMKKLREEEQATGEVGPKEEEKMVAWGEQKEEESKANDIGDINEEMSRGAKGDTEMKKLREEGKERREVVLGEEGKKEVSGDEKEESKDYDIGDISEEGSRGAENHTGTKKLREEEQATREVGPKEEGKKEARGEQTEEEYKADDVGDISEERIRAAMDDTEMKKLREQEKVRGEVGLEKEAVARLSQGTLDVCNIETETKDRTGKKEMRLLRAAEENIPQQLYMVQLLLYWVFLCNMRYFSNKEMDMTNCLLFLSCCLFELTLMMARLPSEFDAAPASEVVHRAFLLMGLLTAHTMAAELLGEYVVLVCMPELVAALAWLIIYLGSCGDDKAAADALGTVENVVRNAGFLLPTLVVIPAAIIIVTYKDEAEGATDLLWGNTLSSMVAVLSSVILPSLCIFALRSWQSQSWRVHTTPSSELKGAIRLLSLCRDVPWKALIIVFLANIMLLAYI